MTFGLTIRTGALTVRSTPGTVSAWAIRCSSAAALTRRPFCSLTFSSDGKSTSASRAGRFSLPLTRFTRLLYRAARVGHARRHLRVLLAAGDVAGDAGDDRAVAAGREGLVDHAAHVGLHAGVLGREREAGLAAAHRDRLLERLLELAPHHALGLGGGHAAHVDPGDRHALRDRVIARAVVRERSDRAADKDQEDDGHEDEPTVPHGGMLQGSCASGRCTRLGARLRRLDA